MDVAAAQRERAVCIVWRRRGLADVGKDTDGGRLVCGRMVAHGLVWRGVAGLGAPAGVRCHLAYQTLCQGIINTQNIATILRLSQYDRVWHPKKRYLFVRTEKPRTTMIAVRGFSYLPYFAINLSACFS